MTIQAYTNNNTKSSTLLSSLLNKPISTNNITKPSKSSIRLNQNLLQSSLHLVKTNTATKKIPNPSIIPIKSAHHRVNWQWTKSNDQSLVLSDDKKTVVFHPDCTSCFETDAVRGDQPLKPKAFTYWETTVLNCNKLNGTSVQIGIGNSKAKLNSLGYLNLLGIDANSYGLTHNGDVWHGNKSATFCEAWALGSKLDESITIGCLFNGFNGQLSYYRNGRCLGVAFDRIDMSESLYSMIGSTVGQSGFRLEMACESFPSLKDMCRKSVMSCGGGGGRIELESQVLPRSVLEFLKV